MPSSREATVKCVKWVLIATMSAAGVPEGEPVGGEGYFRAGVETSLRKVFRSPPQVGSYLAGSARLSLAANEHEAFQVVVEPVGGDLLGVRASASVLQGRDSGHVLPSHSVSVTQVGYVQTRPPPLGNTTYQTGDFPVGWWPDPLLPVASVDVLAGEGAQPFWVDVYAPRGTPPDTYEGHIRIDTRDRGATTIPMQVRVWDFELPVRHSLKTAFSFSLSALHQYYHGKGTFDEDTEIPPQVLQRLYDFLLAHRVSPTNIYNPFHRQQFPRREDLPYCVERGLDAFNVGRLVAGSWDTDEGRAYRSYVREYVDFLQARGWVDLAYVYGPDEIQYRPNYAELKERHREGVRALRSVAPGLEVMATTDIDPDLHGWVDLWCPLAERWDGELARQYAAAGEKSWFYWCIGGSRPALLIDFPAIDPRLIGWLCWKYQVEGFLYYWINMWQGRDPGDGRPLFPEAPWEFCTPAKSGNGSGLLIYPGRQMGEVYSSIRFENIRDGLEDYEYLQRLRELVLQAEEAGVARALTGEARELLQVGDLIRSPTEFAEAPEVLLAHREKVAGAIEAMRMAVDERTR